MTEELTFKFCLINLNSYVWPVATTLDGVAITLYLSSFFSSLSTNAAFTEKPAPGEARLRSLPFSVPVMILLVFALAGLLLCSRTGRSSRIENSSHLIHCCLPSTQNSAWHRTDTLSIFVESMNESVHLAEVLP